MTSCASRNHDIFHSHGGDVILTGHDHNCERFGPLDAFGNADPLAPRQFVVGTGGANPRDVGELEPTSEASAGRVLGVLALTLHETSYDWEFFAGSRPHLLRRGQRFLRHDERGAGQVTVRAAANGARLLVGAAIALAWRGSEARLSLRR